MELTTHSQVGKKNTIYLPKSVVKITGIKEGMKILLIVEDGKITIEPVHDPIELAIMGKKFAKMSVEEVEEISSEHQAEYSKTSS